MDLTKYKSLPKRITIGGSLILTSALLSLMMLPAAHAQEREEYEKIPAELSEPYIPSAQVVDPATAAALSLDELLVFADLNAPTIRVARAEVERVKADQTAARAPLPENPVLGVGAGPRIIDGDSGLSFEVSLEQTIELSGARGLRLDALQAAEQVALAEVNEARWAIHVQTHALYNDLLVNIEQREQARRFLEFAQSLRDIAQRRIDAGESSPLTLFAADADLARAGNEVSRANEDETRIRAEIAAVVGWPSESIPPVTGELEPIRKAPDTKVLLTRMRNNHPQLRTRRLASVLAERRIQSAEREAWPDPTLGLSYGREGEPDGGPSPQTWMFSVSVPIPLWQRNQGPRQRAQAELSLAEQKQHAAALKLRSELAAAASALTATAERVEQYDQAVIAPLEQNLTLLQRAYELGEVDIYQISQMRESLLEAHARYIDARHEYYQAAAILEGLVGAELWPTEGSNP